MSTPRSLSGLPSFYGTGLAFPMRLDPTGARPLIAKDEALILASMDQIANTDITERPFLTRNGVPYGTRCRRLVFDSAEVAIDIIRYELKRAFDTWEPRIITDSVDADEVPDSHGGSLIVAVTSFRYRATNRPDNFVTPYRLQRAT